jgi:hypothetical protein
VNSPNSQLHNVGHRRSWLPAILFCALAAGFGRAALANDARPQPAPTDAATPAAVPSDIPSAAPTAMPSAMPPGTMTPMATPKPGAALFDGNWHTTLVPYVWVPNINGTLKFALPNSATTVAKYVNIKAGPNDYLASLNFAIMLTAEVRKGRWSLLGDYINLNLSTTTGSVASISGPHGNVTIPTTLNTATRLTGTLWLLAPNYTLAHGSAGSIDVLAGVRALDSTASATWDFTAGKNDFISRSGSVLPRLPHDPVQHDEQQRAADRPLLRPRHRVRLPDLAVRRCPVSRVPCGGSRKRDEISHGNSCDGTPMTDGRPR